MSKTNMLVLFGAAIIVDYVNVTQIAEASSKFPDNFGGNETRTIEGIEVQVRKVEKLSIDIHGSSQTNSPRSSGVPLSPAATTPLQSPMSSPIASNSPKPKSLTPKAMGNRKTQLEKKTADYKELSTNLKALVAEKIRLKQIIEENNSRIEQINKDLQNKEVKTDKNKLIREKKSLEKVSSDNIEKMENINTSLMQIEDDMLKVRTEIKTLKLQIEEAQNAITDSGAIMFQKPTSSYDAPLSYYLRGNSSSSFENIASEPEDLEKKQQEQQDEEKKFQDLKQKTEQGLSDFDSNRLELQEYLSDPRGEIDEKNI